MTAHPSVLIFLLSSISLIVLPHVRHVPMPILGFFYLLVAWRFAGIWRPQWLPQKWLVTILSLAGIALLIYLHQGLFGRDAGTRLFLIALGLKLMEIRFERDLYLICFLAFVVAASQFLYEQSLLMGGYILLVTCVLFGTLVCINSRNPKPVLALKTASTIIAQAIPMAVVVFILFPRVEAPRWMLLDDQKQHRTGLTDTMEPGSISDLSLSDELVFRAKFEGPIPPPSKRYWRGPVLAQTDGKRWTATTTFFEQHMDKLTFKGQSYHYTLLMEPQEKEWVFGLEMSQQFAKPLSMDGHYLLTTSENPDKRVEYKMASYLSYNTGFITQTEYKRATQLPTNNPPSEQLKQLVTQLEGFTSPPQQFVERILNHFRSEDFHYTLTPPLMEDKPIDTFLFQSRRGFCSHYAAAFVYLMRIAGIPARVVTGYQGGEYNPVGGFLEIRQTDAHAWAEVWIDKKGWVRVDPTAAVAPERIEKNINLEGLALGETINFNSADGNALSAGRWLKQMRQLWGNVDYSWQRWVINYNNANQTKFLSSLGIKDIRTMLYWMLGAIAVITVILSFVLMHKKPKTKDRALRIYYRFCQKLAKHGLIRDIAEGEQDFAERAKATLPDHAGDIDQITRIFIALRYGRTPANPDGIKHLAQQVEAFKAQSK